VKTFLRICYLFLVPFGALLITLATTALFLMKVYHNPVQERVTAAVEEHFAHYKNAPVSLFHNNIFIATKDIAKGEKLDANLLQRQDYGSQDTDPGKVDRYDEQQVVGTVAKNAIAKNQLVFAKDLEENANTRNAEDADKAVSDGEDHFIGFYAVIGIFSILVLLTVVIFAVSHLWITIDAFKKSLMWGIGCLTVPFVRTVFELKYWQQTKKAIQLQVIAFALAGIVLGSLASAKVKMMELQDQLVTTCSVFYCLQNVSPGVVIKSADIDERSISSTKIPEDAITKKSQAVGHKAKYGISCGQIISVDDIEK
jgi:flagella basal body P-ring formation protein FlgA